MGGSGGQPRAVVIGAGIGGLASAVALCAAGWDVTVCERAPVVEPVGSGLALAPNGLRALDAIGQDCQGLVRLGLGGPGLAGSELGDELRAHAIRQAMGIRRPDGRWLLRADSAAMVADRFGDGIILLPRSRVVEALLTRIPEGVLALSTEVLSVSPSGRVVTASGELTADLVVAADGIWSPVRAALWPDEPGPKYAGFTTWRMIVSPGAGAYPMAETWGRGAVFGVMPLADGRVYCYAAAPAPQGEHAPDDELAEMVRRFGGWHEPIPALLATAAPGGVLRHDVAELARPLPAFNHGRVALLGDAAHPMTPNLGQGACQALEDAVVLARMVGGPAGARPSGWSSVESALVGYSAARVKRTQDVVRWSRRAGVMTTWTSPVAVALRDTLASIMGKLSPAAVLRGLSGIYDWQPPE